MSAQFFQSNTPQENQSIKVNDCVVRGAITCSESASMGGGVVAASLNINGNSALRKVTFDPLPVLYTQATSSGTAVDISGAEESFEVETFALTTVAGGIEAFLVNHAGIGASDMLNLTQVSYSGDYNVNGAMCAHIAAVEAGSITVGIKNWGTGSANGAIKLRFKIFHNQAS